MSTLEGIKPPEATERFASRSKTSSGYWLDRVFRFKRKNAKKVVVTDADYSCQISFGGRRERMQLHTPNKALAANKAATIYRDIVGKGWEQALRIHKPKAQSEPASLPIATVGGLISANEKYSNARPESLETYAKALRRLTAGVLKISATDAEKRWDAWLAKVNSIPLEQLTPTAVALWRNVFLGKAQSPEQRGRSAVTVNSLIRNAKALLSKKVRPFLDREMLLPSPLFFEGIITEPEPSLRYRSKIDAEALLKLAKDQLLTQDPEAFKLFLLALVCGLRRSEVDTLLWTQLDLDKHVLFVEDTDHKRLKSKDSAGEIDLEPEMCVLFRTFKAKATSKFVLEPPEKIKKSNVKKRGIRNYRSNSTHQRLLTWLRKHGVHGLRPIHTLRKEIGAIIASRDGIWKASRYLRHSDIRITSKLYADKKVPVMSGFGFLLSEK